MSADHTPQPRFAVITRNTLEGLGFIALLEKLSPMVDARLYFDLAACRADTGAPFVHYFISGQTLLENAEFFHTLQRQTIVLAHGPKQALLPAGFHTLDTAQPEEKFIQSLFQLMHSGHGDTHTPPAAANASPLTPREREVLRLVAMGRINKEVADELNVALTTVISHRKNLTEKLGIKSVSALTIYAVTHGIVRLEDI